MVPVAAPEGRMRRFRRTARLKTRAAPNPSPREVRFSVDPRNRLIVREPGGALGRLGPPRLVEGAFAIGPGNRLAYQASDGAGSRLFRLDGAWALTRRHELALRLQRSEEGPREILVLRGALVGAEAHRLVFALAHHGGALDPARTGLALSGEWRADQWNRLMFLVDKADGAADRLTLQAGWDVGPDQRLRYTYRADTEAGPRITRTVVFDGSWDIPGPGRLAYRLAGSSPSALEFAASLRSPSLAAAAGRIVYDVGVRARAGTTKQRRVTLFGTWKFRRDLSVEFEMAYQGGRVHAIRFEGAARPVPGGRIAVALSTSQRRAIGVTVTFSPKTMPEAAFFLQARRDERERALVGGVRARF